MAEQYESEWRNALSDAQLLKLHDTILRDRDKNLLMKHLSIALKELVERRALEPHASAQAAGGEISE